MFREILGADDIDEIATLFRPWRPSPSEKDKGRDGSSPVVHLPLLLELNATIEILAAMSQENN